MELNSENVQAIFMACLPKEVNEVGAKLFEGIQTDAYLQMEEVAKHKQDIDDMLEQLPEEFKKGWSFLNMCVRKDGVQWTGFHKAQEQLVLLGLATEKLKLLSPKVMWPMMPGGMPYYLLK